MAQELKAHDFPVDHGDFTTTIELFYLKSEVDAVLDAKDKEICKLNNALDKERSETIKYMDELCNAKNEIERLTIDKRNDELRADIADATIEKLKAANAELKQKLDDVQASMYADVVDAGMKNRRLQRALYIVLARSFRYMRELAARNALYDDECKWDNFKTKCLKKAEEYK